MITHVGWQGSYKANNLRCKFTEDVNCLSPDIWEYQRNNYRDIAEVMRIVRVLETIKIRCCVDFTDYFYETEVN